MVEKKQINFPRYEHYKDSGVDWIGDIPVHWEVQRIKQIFHERVEKNDPIKTTDILSLSMHLGVTPYSEDRGGNKAKDDLTAYHLAYPNDIVVNSMNVIVGSVGLSKYFGAVSPVYHMLYLRSQTDDIHFYDAVFQNKGFQQGLIRLGNGILIKRSESSGKLNTIRMRIPMSKLAKVFLPHPPLPEQTAIAQFLDHKTAQIDRAIAIKEAQIKLLNERKQIMIQEAVTKGLDPSVPMKDSGIEWIGEIPAHWEVERLFSLAKIKSITGHSDKELLSVYLNLGVVKFSEIEEKRTNATSENLDKYQLVESGDFVLNNQQAWRGSVGVSFFNGIVSPAYLVLTLPKYFNRSFANYLFRDQIMVSQYLVGSRGVGTIQRNLYWNELKNVRVPIPPLPEQTAITQFLDHKTAQLDRGVEKIKSQIQTLKEYKTTLINEAVTGKIKVY